MSTNQILFALLIMVVVTFALRALPFFLRGFIDSKPFFAYAKYKLPAMMLFVLVFYAVGAHESHSFSYYTPQAIALICTAVTHLFRGSFLLSIFIGTGVYMLIVNGI